MAELIDLVEASSAYLVADFPCVLCVIVQV
jgi:hypothetical protein